MSSSCVSEINLVASGGNCLTSTGLDCCICGCIYVMGTCIWLHPCMLLSLNIDGNGTWEECVAVNGGRPWNDHL